MAKKTTEPPSGGWILDDLLPQLADYYDHYRRTVHAGRATRELEAVREELAGVFRRDEYTDHFPKIAYKSFGLNAVMAVWPRDPQLAEFQVNIAYSNPATGSDVLPYPAFEMFSLSLKDNAIASGGLHKMSLNDSLIDAAFNVFGKEEYPIRKLLDRAARESIMSIYGMLPHRTLYLGLEYERVLVKKVVPSAMLTAASLRDLNDRSRKMIDGFLATLTVSAADAEMVEILEVVLPEEIARCRVCGERILLDKIECRRCDTQHHKDCWDYNGKCAMYACGETRYRSA